MGEVKKYDFDLIVPSVILEERKRNTKKLLKSVTKKYRLKKWCKLFLVGIVGFIAGTMLLQFFTVKTVESTPLGNYVCNGKYIRICTGPKEVASFYE